MLYDYSYSKTRKKFFSKEVSFNNFESISDDKREEISKKVTSFLKAIDSDNLNGLEKYVKVLEYLSAPNIHYYLPTFDEQILFFILACDKDLFCLSSYKDSQIISIKQINEATKKEKKDLESQRSQQLHEFMRNFRDRYGFYDSKLLKYESIYFERIVKLDSLASNIKSDVTSPLLDSMRFIRSFESVSDEDFEKIKLIAEEYKKSVADPSNIHTLSYNIITRRKKVRITNLRAKLVLIIYIIDPELKILKIYEEESTIDEIKRRCIEEFGYYNMELIRLERLYHQRFCPNKIISDWSDERKLLWTQD